MSTLSLRLSRAIPRPPIRPCLFFLLFYLYVWLRVDPRLMYFWLSPAFPTFSLSPGFFRAFLARPGGPVEYLAAFLSQFHYYSWAGALVITVVAVLLSLATGVFIKSMGDARPRVIHFVPAAMLLLFYNRYFHALSVTPGLLTAMAFVCVYVRMRSSRPAARLAIFLALSALLYYIAGGAFLLYAVLCGLFELLAAKRRLLGLFCLVCAVVIPYCGGMLVFRLGIADAFGRLLPYHLDTDVRAAPLAVCLYLFFPLVAVGTVLWRRHARRASAAPEQAVPGIAAGFMARLRRTKLKWVYESVALLIVVAIPVWLSFHRPLNTWLQMEYFGCHKMWSRVLDKARELPHQHFRGFLIGYDVNRALYHTGRLPDEMFFCPQRPGGLLITPLDMVGDWGTFSEPLMKFSDILFELGRINESEHMAQEAFELVGARPRVVQRLALARIIKGQPESARVFLRALSADLLYGSWARDILRRLQTDPLLSTDREVQRVRSLMPLQDSAFGASVEMLLEELLERDKRNPMAFEYLMGYYLVTRNLEGIVRNIGRLDDFDYEGIPRHYEEALVIYLKSTGKEVDLRGRSVSWPTLRRHAEFSQVFDHHRDSKREASRALAKDYWNTYYYYYWFGGAEETE